MNDLDELLRNYDRVKEDFYESVKSNAITRITRGAQKFMETLIKLQTTEGSFGLNQTMLQFKDYVERITQNLEEQKDEKQTGGNLTNI